MRSVFSIVALSLLMLAIPLPAVAQEEEKAQDKNNARLAGKWVADVDKTKELNSDEIDDRMLEEITNIAFEFKAEGEVKMTMGSNAMDAKFELTAHDDDENLFDLKMEGDNTPGPMTGTLKFVDDDTVHLTPDGQQTAVFVRSSSVTEEASDEIKAELHGSWKGDVDATLKGAEEMNLPDQVLEGIKSQIGKMGLKFNDDGTYTLSLDENDVEGTWTLYIGEEKDTYHLVAEPETGATLNFVVQFHDDDFVSMQSRPTEAAAWFKKAK